MRGLLTIVLAVGVLVACAHGSGLTDEMYTTLQGNTACTTLLNIDGQIGCSCTYVMLAVVRRWKAGLVFVIRNDALCCSAMMTDRSETLKIMKY